MKILVTGAQGQVGREVMELPAKDLPLVGYSREALDITELAQVVKAVRTEKPQLVINCAAYTAVDKAEQERGQAFAVNKEGVRNLALVCREHDLPLIHISTDYVFNGEKEKPYSEEDLRSPMSVYGASKAEGELILQSIWEKHLILRVSWVFGRYGHNFVKTILRLAAKEKELRIVSDQRGCPTPAADLAETLLNLAEQVKQGRQDWGIYHYAGDKPVSWYDFAGAIVKQGKKHLDLRCEKIHPISTADYPTPAKRPKNSVLQQDKIQKVYGIQPPEWEKALAEAIQKLS